MSRIPITCSGGVNMLTLNVLLIHVSEQSSHNIFPTFNSYRPSKSNKSCNIIDTNVGIINSNANKFQSYKRSVSNFCMITYDTCSSSCANAKISHCTIEKSISLSKNARATVKRFRSHNREMLDHNKGNYPPEKLQGHNKK